MSSLTRQQLEAWIKTLSVSGKVLDAGGSQKLAKGRVGAREGTEFVILDLENPHEDSSKPDIVWDLNSKCYSWDDAPMKYEDSFDYVLCFEVFEYLWNPYQALDNFNKFLKVGGTLYLSVPFVYPVHNPKDNDYLRYTDKGISVLLEKADFKVEELIPRNATNHEILQGFYGAEGMKASKDYNSHKATGWLIKATKI